MTDFEDLSLKRLLEHAHIGVVIHRWDTSVVYANPTSLKLLRLSYEQIIGKDSYDPQWSFLDDSSRKMLIEDYPVNKIRNKQDRLTNETIGVIDSSRDNISWFMLNAYLEGKRGDDSCFIVVTFNDISAFKHTFSYEAIVRNSQDMVIVTEADDVEAPLGPKIVYVNEAFQSLTGYSRDDVIGETPRILQGDLTDKKATKRIYQALVNREPVTESVLNYDSTGRPYWVEMNIIPLKNRFGEVTHFAAIERDISEHKFRLEQLKKRNDDLKALKRDLTSLVEKRTIELQKAKAQLEKIAFFDPLTQLPNRRFFYDQVNKLVKSAQRKNLSLVFGLLDVDNFKALNDQYGHDYGDQVLKSVAMGFRDLMRADDAFCRYGGEEFAFAAAIQQSEGAHVLARRIVETISELQIEFSAEKTVCVTVSLGYLVEESPGDSCLDEQLKQADLAMYQAKENGKNTCVNAADLNKPFSSPEPPIGK